MFEYFIAQIFIACSIAIDAWIVTLLLKSHQKLDSRFIWKWVGAITITHTVFPAIGQLLTFTYSDLKLIECLSYLTGILVFIWLLFLSNEDEVNLSEPKLYLLVLMTSWDSLVIGFVKLVLIKTWSFNQVISSIFIVGILVGISVYLMTKLINKSLIKSLDNLLKLIAITWIILNTYGLIKLYSTI